MKRQRNTCLPIENICCLSATHTYHCDTTAWRGSLPAAIVEINAQSGAWPISQDTQIVSPSTENKFLTLTSVRSIFNAIGIYITGQSGVWYSTFAAYRDASRDGEGHGEEREKCLPCDPESESLQGVSSCCPKTHRRASHVTPDLRWHGQHCLTVTYTYPRSTSLASTEFSHINSWRLCLFHYTYLRTDCCRGGVHPVQQKHAPSYIHHTTSLFQ